MSRSVSSWKRSWLSLVVLAICTILMGSLLLLVCHPPLLSSQQPLRRDLQSDSNKSKKDHGSAVVATTTKSTSTASRRLKNPDQQDVGEYDCIVVGAGLSGLAAALELEKQGQSVLVLEARSRVGGRVFSFSTTNNNNNSSTVALDGGASFVGDPQTRVMELVRKYQLALIDTPNQGKNVFWRRKHRQLFRAQGLLGAVPVGIGIIQVAIAQARLDRESRKFPPGQPWKHPHATKYDQMTWKEWVHRNVLTKPARFLLELLVSSSFSVPSSEVSALFVFHYVAAAGNEDLTGSSDILLNVNTRVNRKDVGGGQQYHIQHGAEQLAWALLQEFLTGSTERPTGQNVYDSAGVLPELDAEVFFSIGNDDNSSAIQLDSPVRRIDYTDQVVRVASDRAIATAQHIVLALPPTMVRTIEFIPPLPPGRMQLNDRMPMGATSKTFTFYDRPFWRDDGLTGQAISDYSGDDSGLIEVTYDLTDDNDDSVNRPGIMMGFINGNKARGIDNLATKADEEFDPDSNLYQTVRSETIKSLVKFFGGKAADFQDFAFNRWNDDVWTRGGPVAVPHPGVITQYWQKHLSTSVGDGRIHWAGTETSDYWTGFMDGALRAGYRVATEIANGSSGM